LKRPAFQFYTKDWKTNMKLRRCSEAARGAWIDILCSLHDGEEYGVARFPLKELADVAGVKLKSARELVDKGVLKGNDADVPAFVHTPRHAGKSLPPVTLLEASAGPMWYSSRMVRDEWVRGRSGGATRFGSDNQPSGRQGDPPKPSPSPRPGEPPGDGAAVASASAVSLNQLSKFAEGGTPTPTAAGGDQPPDPVFVEQAMRGCKQAKVHDASPDHAVIAKWYRLGYGKALIEKALTEARIQKGGQTLYLAFVDAIAERVAREERAVREQASSRDRKTQGQIAEQREMAKHAAPMTEEARKYLPRFG
jgi:hypothetical protein